jgi:hypothetical protein
MWNGMPSHLFSLEPSSCRPPERGTALAKQNGETTSAKQAATNSALKKGKHKEDCMKKLVAVALFGAALATFPVTVAMKQTGLTAGSDQALAQGAPCYKGEASGPCPKPKAHPRGR